MTLRYVLENPRLEVFVPGLRSKISEVLTTNDRYMRKCGGGKRQHVCQKQQLQSVRFQSDTDNRENFPDAQTFQASFSLFWGGGGGVFSHQLRTKFRWYTAKF